MSLLGDFRNECRDYYTSGRRDSNAVSARVRVYRELLSRHGKDPVVRHWNTMLHLGLSPAGLCVRACSRGYWLAYPHKAGTYRWCRPCC